MKPGTRVKIGNKDWITGTGIVEGLGYYDYYDVRLASNNELKQYHISQLIPEEEENIYPQFRNVTLNINDVYGTYQPEIPKGWKAIDFRLVKQGDNYLAADGSTPSVNFYLKEPSFGFVRIIVEEDKPKTVQFLVTCENNPINSAFASDRLLYTSRTEVYKVLNIEKKGE